MAMKKTLVAGLLVIMGGSAISVTALDKVALHGSAELNEFTLSMLSSATCPDAVGLSLAYRHIDDQSEFWLGANCSGCSKIPAQTVEPMTRFLKPDGEDYSGACNAADSTAAEGIAFAVNAAAVITSRTHAACDANAASGTGCTTQAGGLRRSGTLNGGAYTLGTASVAGWRDVLRLVYFGLANTAGANPNPAATIPVRDCASPVRADLVNNYGNLFEDAACGTGGCTQLTHAWRHDNFSSTTDMFRELVLARGYPFCNYRFAVDPITPATVTYPTVLSTGAPLFDDAYQDFDPIRRTCAGGANGGGAFLPLPTNGGTVQPPFPSTPAEQVCGPKGTFGLVLPIRAPVGLSGSISISDAFPTKPCLRGSFTLGPAPKVPGSQTKDTLCPNGDVPVGNSASDYNAATGQVVGSSGLCFIPAAADGDAQCINGRNNLPAVVDPPNPALVATDGRVYNLHMYGPGATPTYKVDIEVGKTPTSTANRQIVADFARIHSTRTLIAAGPTCPGIGGSGRCCDKFDSTDQIGCLADADPCSIGVSAGRSLDQTLVTSGTTERVMAASVNGIAFRSECVSSLSYPIAHKLYLNTLSGFEQVTGQELALAKCFSGGVAGFNFALYDSGFYPLPTGPVCEDFAQETCGLGLPASDACQNNPAGIPTNH